VFRQVVAHRWSPRADAAARDGFRAAMESLRAVPELVSLHHADDAGHFAGNHDYVAAGILRTWTCSARPTTSAASTA
jgi:hypothetical protein